MPTLAYAVLADYVRAETGVAHVIAAGIDTVGAPQVPTGQNLALLAGVRFTRAECGRPHRFEVLFSDEDGAVLSRGTGIVVPEWDEDLPPHWVGPCRRPSTSGSRCLVMACTSSRSWSTTRSSGACIFGSFRTPASNLS